ncbi:MAG: Phage SPO1 DNA polymerase-related protein [Candidatus Woesebacteria bacterium GW2011_GWA1_37_8]|uniref:Type-4 uracil-DNA glycosylase n=1 Tax=Candidatus Woesebacteria bacterium GW2011_GWA1_37_8 TaxID=1618546 RepID=A0A0G0K8D5_9BACT|nr:MAG: Phage SPO1 DNA polymerase-related protein [Microgenomates group bacterium GW2011_GWC1_37_12b]KKQ45394.1 MAG: Phage SPO1 DNA polymerase-related protein [Candidatus Woesebacteria bacterium GW2011_GWA1_37_8]
MTSTDKISELEKLKKKMLADEDLPLKKGATNLVFSDGSPDAEIMFIGEGPGYWEDQKSLPFVGNAGMLLNQLLASIKLKREDVFITNVVHHRPPENRDPEQSELDAYKPYLDEMIKIVDPRVIITLGRFSMGKFMPGVMISSVHGKPRKVNFGGAEILVIPMYHPAAALRNGNVKAQMLTDFKNIPDIIKQSEEVKEEKVEENDEKDIQQMNLL